MKFNSQICTTVEQSQRLLSLGLKKETADMAYRAYGRREDGVVECATIASVSYGVFSTHDIPAWSLHRLIEMMPQSVTSNNRLDYYKVMYNSSVCYQREYYNLYRSCKRDLYEDIVSCIEWLIKEGYFNKEYLV